MKNLQLSVKSIAAQICIAAVFVFDVCAQAYAPMLHQISDEPLFASDAMSISGNFDLDSYEEFAITVKDSSGKTAIMIYDFIAPKTLKRIAEADRFEATNVRLAVGNLDEDERDEVVIVAQEGSDGAGQLTILVYDDVANHQKLQRIGDIQLEASKAQLVLADVDADDQDEIIVTAREGRDGKGKVKVMAFNLVGPNDLRLTAKADQFEAAHTQLAAGDVDGDGYDEIILTSQEGNDGTGRLAILVYDDLVGHQKLERIGDRRLEASKAEMTLADVDSDGHHEIIVAVREGRDGAGKLAIMVLDLVGPNDLRRTAEADRFEAAHAQLDAGDVDGDGRDEIVVSAQEGLDGAGKLTVLAYDDLLDRSVLMPIFDLQLDAVSIDHSIADTNNDGIADIVIPLRERRFGFGRFALLVYALDGSDDLKRPGDIRHGNLDNSSALRDGNDPETGIDVLSEHPDSWMPSLRWADGMPSGFKIRNISGSASKMSFYVDVPK
ncbi:MAG: FG-GAP repeat protein [Candidatus Thiodiazotropha sp.]